MAKVTLVIEDVDGLEGKSKVTIHGDFDQPGKSYEEMTTNPTGAVALGLQVIAMALEDSDSFSGKMTDEFGTTKEFHK